MRCAIGILAAAGFYDINDRSIDPPHAWLSDVAPDMWWFHPAIKRTDGIQIPATDVFEHHLGREWQRWSRHLTPGQWQSGIDSLESYVALIQKELLAARPAVAA